MKKRVSTRNKVIATLMIMVMVFTAIPFTVFADDTQIELDYSIVDGGAVIIQHNSSEPYVTGDVVIPETLGGYPVVGIKYMAFWGLDITSVTMPNTIKYLEDRVFNLSSIKTVKLSAGLETIGEYVFYLTDVEGITLPDGLQYIGYGAFQETQIDTFHIPASVTTFDGNVVGGCKNLTEITVDADNQNYVAVDGVLYTKDMKTIVAYPAGKTDEIFTVPEGVETIGKGAFYGNEYLKKVILPNGVKTICDSGFWGCTNRAEIALPDTITDIEEYAFYSSGLVNVSIPQGVSIINPRVFGYCEQLREVNIPSSVTEISYSAFVGCGLESITIPKTVKKIGDSAFGWCENLTKIVIYKATTSVNTLAFSQTNPDLTVYTESGSNAQYVANKQGFNVVLIEPEYEIKNVEYNIVGDKVVFSVTTGSGMNRVKVTYADDLKSYIAYSDKYSSNSDGDYVFTVSVPVESGLVEYAFDGRRDDTGKYARAYLYQNVEIDESVVLPEILDVQYAVDGNYVYFDVTTTPCYNRVKISYGNDVTSYIVYSNEYEVLENGNYVFRLSNIPATFGDTEYAFDGRRVDTGKYGRNYYYKTVTVDTHPNEFSDIISVSHEISNGKIVFTVVTEAGSFDRVKVTTDDALSGSAGVGTVYTVDGNGNYVWTLKATMPREDTVFAFDIREVYENIGKSYTKRYFFYEFDAQPTIIDVTHQLLGDKLEFKVTTLPGNYDRIKLTVADNLSGSQAISTKYVVNGDGNYVWTITVNALEQYTEYVFDIRVAGGKYLKEYFYYDNDIRIFPDNTDTANQNKVVDYVYTSSNGGIQMEAIGWKTYGLYNISMVPEDYNNAGTTNCIMVGVYDAESVDVFENRTQADMEDTLNESVISFTKTELRGYTCYEAVSKNYRVWLFQTETNKYFINFIHAEGAEDLQQTAIDMMKTIRIYY